jgi:energy-coupling factor transporter ATP-binding protein EcfA2
VITQLRVQGFKSLRDVRLKLGRFNLFVGANASGKSNLFDAIRFLQGVGNGFTIDEILNGKPKTATSEVWEPIRGGSDRVEFKPAQGEADQAGITVSASFDRPSFAYSIRAAPGSGHLAGEQLEDLWGTIYRGEDNQPYYKTFTVRYYSGKRGQPPKWLIEKHRPGLTQISKEAWCEPKHATFLRSCATALANVQRLDPVPAVLREYSAPRAARIGERGENFAAVVKEILSDEVTKSAYEAWLRKLTPAELGEVRILTGALGEPLFALHRNGVDFPAPVLSDGTLRFAALTAAFFQPDMPELLLIEEIENGIHADRLRLLMELFRTQAGQKNVQVFATTHSPVALSWLTVDDFSTTFYCRKDETGASTFTPFSQIPRLVELCRSQSIADLFAEGWLESAA